MLVKNGVNIAHTENKQPDDVSSKIATYRKDGDYFYTWFSRRLKIIQGLPFLAKKCDTHTPALLDTVVDGVKALRSNDLLFRHPTNPNLWKVYGRQDDQIMHSTGEKTNPVPIEAILLKNPEIKYAVMFGRSKFHAGANGGRANRFAPTHSRIFKEMMLIASPSKPIELTPERNPPSSSDDRLVRERIQEVYAAVDESSQTHLTAPEDYDPSSSLEFVRSIVAEVMVEMPGDDEDIFQHGCDSLQATWIRNSILHALRNSARINIKAVPSTFVYSHPTLRLLADMLVRLASGNGAEVRPGLSAASRKLRGPKMQAVLVTGTTGALGSHVIAQLLALPDISTVYAFNRPGSDLRARQRDSCETNGINIQLDSPKLKLLEGDLNLPPIRLSQEDMQTIRKNVTLIIHNAWQVNFNISLPSMEPLVAGTRKLIDFALASPHPSAPRLSSSSPDWTGTPPRKPITDARTSVGLGYSESKWVAETILELAAQQTALSPIIVRPGQLSGAANGAWNTTDWFPVLLRASQLLKHLPDLSGRASWVPIHVAASALIEIMAGLTEADAVQEFAASTNPAVRLLEFFRSYQEVSDEQEAFFPAVLGNTYGIRTASSLQSIAPLSALDYL
ncbi:male sterility protein-domain-containing protein [Mycena rosella]|uniref:Male sterility protein-domain-containing protein n=1 Tax=Mycena rosella TaxID=1033263 RepID=A0AAD7F741_MYCRO|nr:male sterility protein-domain-containing protein [Mycena rosella]